MIQWQDFGSVQYAGRAMFEVEEYQGQWRGIDNYTRETGPVTDLHLALAWCEDRIAARAIAATVDCEPDFVVEGT